MNTLQTFNQFVTESSDELSAVIFRDRDRADWWLYVTREPGTGVPMYFMHGPFKSADDAERQLSRKYANPGGFSKLTNQPRPETTGQLTEPFDFRDPDKSGPGPEYEEAVRAMGLAGTLRESGPAYHVEPTNDGAERMHHLQKVERLRQEILREIEDGPLTARIWVESITGGRTVEDMKMKVSVAAADPAQLPSPERIRELADDEFLEHAYLTAEPEPVNDHQVRAVLTFENRIG